MTQQSLSALTTGWIAVSGVSLLTGWFFIRRRRDRRMHRNFMLAATGCAGLFLVFYVTRWHLFGSKPFEGEGWWRVLYLGVLLPHVLLAMVLGPAALYVIWLALKKGDFERHRRLARLVVPVWLYVAFSGWLVYALLYWVPFVG